MIEFLTFSEDVRRQLINQVNIKTGIAPVAIEKDWWVTLVLKALFSLPMSEYFIFKGGTSLSKGWRLIERFSEDIDIALSPEAFGKLYNPVASKSYVKSLKRMGCAYTSTLIYNALQARLSEMGVPEGILAFTVEEVPAELPDKDPQTIYVNYPSLYIPSAYMPPRVKIEFGVRSLKEPFAPVPIISILAAQTESPAYQEEPFIVSAVEPRKTFMEKLLLLHEKFQTASIQDFDAERQSRHLYDLVEMVVSGIAEEVKVDQDLYTTLLRHRTVYVGQRNVDYSKMQLCELKFLPPYMLMTAFRQDYRTMQEEMLYGNPPDFDALVTAMRKLNRELVTHGLDFDIQYLIEEEIKNIKNRNSATDFANITIEYAVDGTVKASFEAEIILENGEFVAHRIIRAS